MNSDSGSAPLARGLIGLATFLLLIGGLAPILGSCSGSKGDGVIGGGGGSLSVSGRHKISAWPPRLPAGATKRVGSPNLSHRCSTDGLSWHGDGEHLISGDRCGWIYVWAATAGRLIGERRIDADLGLSVSADGETIAMANSSGGTVIVLKTESLEELGRVHVDGWKITRTALNPTGKLLAASGGRDLRVFKLPGGQEVTKIEVADEPEKIAFGPRGKLLAASVENGVMIYSTATWAMTTAFVLDSDSPVVAFAFSQAGHRLAWSPMQGRIRVGNLDTRSELPRVKAPATDALDFDAGARSLVAHEAYTGKVEVRPIDSGASRTIGIAHGAKTHLATAPGGKRVAVANEHAIRVFPLDGSRASESVPLGPRELLFDEGRGQLIAFARGGRVQVRPLSGAPKTKVLETSVLAYGGGLVAAAKDDNIVLWNPADGKDRLLAPPPLGADTDQVQALALAPDAKLVAWSHVRSDVAGIMRAADMKKVHQLKHGDRVVAAAFDDGGKRVATLGRSGVALWNVADGKEIRRVVTPRNATRLIFAGDDHLLIGAGQLIGVYSLKDGTRTFELPAMTLVRDLPLAGSAKHIAYSKGRHVHVHQTSTGQAVGQPRELRSVVSGLAFGSGGAVLTAAGHDGTVTFWKL